MKRWGKYFPILALLAVGLFAAAPAAAQTGSVTGTILSSDAGQPLDAVQVSLEAVGTGEVRYGGLTQASGRYLIINIPVGQYVLRAELLGFGTQTQVVDIVGGQTTVVDFRLEPAAITLSEIVVTGVAGATQRTKLPFDVAQVRIADLPVPSMNAAQSIQGKVAGAQVVQSSGRPGSAPSILLRGVTSLDASGRSQEPLFIVDGVILGSSMVDLDALDIQSVEVVKGAAAASLYGSRAANGVIQIRTKRGTEMADDQIRYSFRSEYGQSYLGEVPDLLLTEVHEFRMNAAGTKFLDRDGNECDWLLCASIPLAGQGAAAGETPTAWNTYQTNRWPGKTYNQIKRFFTGGTLLQNSITAEGRSGRTNFHVSASQLDEGGIMRYEPGLRRTNFRINVDQAVVEDLTVQTSILYSRSKAGNTDGPMFALTRVPAGVDLLGEDPFEPGEMLLTMNPQDNESPNPLYTLKTIDQLAWRNRFLGSATARYSPTNWLKIDGNVSFDRSDRNNETLYPKGYRTADPSPGYNDGRLSLSNSRTEALNASVTASTVWNPTPDIRNTTQVRYLMEREDNEGFNTTGWTFAVADVYTLDNVASDNVTNGSSITSIRADGYFFITNFDMYDKYVVDALVRNDGSSLFGADERRQWYYRLGGAWRISQEDFFNIDAIDELKFRYSVGTAGGRPNFAAQYETYSVSGGRVQPVTLGNKDLKPEFSTEHEAGFDMSLFNYKVILSGTYAQTTTEDQILQVPQPAFTGFSRQWRNAGTIESKTWEATLDLRLLERPNLNWSARLLWDATKSTITELNVPAFTYGTPGQGRDAVFYARAGEEIGDFYGYMAATKCGDLPEGTSCSDFAVNDDGFLVWVGPGGSLSNPQWGTSGPVVAGKPVNWGTPFAGVCIDRTTGEESLYCKVGNSIPDYNIGLSSTLTWKGVSLYALVNHSANFDVFNLPLQWGTFKRLTGILDQTNVPEGQRKPIGYYDGWYAVSNQIGISSIYVEDATYTKLRELSLTYRFGPDLLGYVPGLDRFTSIGLNLTGRNLFTWTDYTGFDPETGTTGGDTGSAAIARTDGYNYPNFRTFSASLEFVF